MLYAKYEFYDVQLHVTASASARVTFQISVCISVDFSEALKILTDAFKRLETEFGTVLRFESVLLVPRVQGLYLRTVGS